MWKYSTTLTTPAYGGEQPSQRSPAPVPESNIILAACDFLHRTLTKPRTLFLSNMTGGDGATCNGIQRHMTKTRRS
jgi:hypothetical protein